MPRKKRPSRDPELALYLDAKLPFRRRVLRACYVEFDNSGNRDE
jgi:hypothetical protein